MLITQRVYQENWKKPFHIRHIPSTWLVHYILSKYLIRTPLNVWQYNYLLVYPLIIFILILSDFFIRYDKCILSDKNFNISIYLVSL